jgi:SAM-dependent methyltransferase
MLASLSIEAAPSTELRNYIDEDFERFLLTWDAVSHLHGGALEIGANPYFTTILLREFTDLSLTLTNSFGPTTVQAGRQHISYEQRDHCRHDVEMDFRVVNVENEPLPFDDDTFDVVIFCEVIEHLLTDPLRALREIRRVLRPDGTLLVSTPNVARLENVARLSAGLNIYDPYSGHGPYGRHNREFTRHELVRLIEFAGFEPTNHFTVDVHPHHASGLVDMQLMAPLLNGRLGDLGQYIFCSAEKRGTPRTGRPAEIFRSFSADEIVTWEH